MSVVRFLAAFVGVYLAIIVAVAFNVTGLVGPPIDNNPFDREHKLLADLIVVGFAAAAIAGLTIYRARQPVKTSYLAGAWTACVAAALVFITR